MQSIYLTSRENKKAGFIPCILYGKNTQFKKGDDKNDSKPYIQENFSISIQSVKELKSNKLKTRAIPFQLHYPNSHGDMQQKTAIVREIQFHPLDGSIMHLDFFIVDELSKFEVLIPIRVIGKENSIAIKEGAVVNQMFKNIKAFRSLGSSTEEIVVDISNLKKKDIIHAKDLSIKDLFIKNNPVILTII